MRLLKSTRPMDLPSARQMDSSRKYPARTMAVAATAWVMARPMAAAFRPPADETATGTAMANMPTARLRRITMPVCISPMLRRAMDMLDEVKDAERARDGRVAASRTAVPAARMPIWKETRAKLTCFAPSGLKKCHVRPPPDADVLYPADMKLSRPRPKDRMPIRARDEPPQMMRQLARRVN